MGELSLASNPLSFAYSGDSVGSFTWHMRSGPLLFHYVSFVPHFSVLRCLSFFPIFSLCTISKDFMSSAAILTSYLLLVPFSVRNHTQLYSHDLEVTGLQ